jgi:hypothetical protein
MNSKERAISRKVYLLIVLGLIVIGFAWTRIQTARNLSVPTGHEERTLTIGGLERRQQQTVPSGNGTVLLRNFKKKRARDRTPVNAPEALVTRTPIPLGPIACEGFGSPVREA